MAYEFYVSVEGSKQGKLKGESPREAHKEKFAGIAYLHEVRSPRDLQTGQASGKRQHGPVTITKEWGPATPQLFQALVTNEVLKSVLFEFIKTTPEGQEEVYHKVKLTNATVASIRQISGDVASSGAERGAATYSAHEREEISFTYQKIELENIPGKTASEDDWHK